jgi:hypothetical protein
VNALSEPGQCSSTCAMMYPDMNGAAVLHHPVR